MRSLILCVLTTLFLLARPASAQNIDMSTLPARESVQLTIYNAEDLTLVRERRTVTVRNGITQLQFSWANTLIDPSSDFFLSSLYFFFGVIGGQRRIDQCKSLARRWIGSIPRAHSSPLGYGIDPRSRIPQRRTRAR